MEITAAELSKMLNGKLEGDGDVKVNGFAKIEEAKTGDLSFISNPKYTPFIHSTQASVVLVGEDFHSEGSLKPVLIRVGDPYAALAQLLRLAESAKPKPKGIEQPVFLGEGVDLPEDCYIGAFAYIGKGSSIGAGTLVYPQVYIGANVTIGAGSIIYAGVKIYDNTVIGERCILHSGCVIGADGFGFAPTDGRYEKIPQTGRVFIEDDVEVGANTTIDRATFGETVIGKGTKLDNLIQIAHNVKLGENNVFAAQTGVAGSTCIGSGNRIGGQVGFAGHIKIGDNNEFGAQSGISKNIGNNQRLIGYPAMDIKLFARNAVYMRRLDELFRKK